MREIKVILTSTEKAISKYEADLQELTELQQILIQTGLELAAEQKKLELYEDVRILLQELAEVTREEVASDLERVVTLCLQAVFGEELSFEIEIDTSRNTTVIEFYVVDTSGPEVVKDTPEDSMGGGIVDTCAIGLRFGLLQILNPRPVGPIVMDEPAKMVSRDLIEGIASLVQELTSLFNKQTILVTHHTSVENVIENPVHFAKINGYTSIEQ